MLQKFRFISSFILLFLFAVQVSAQDNKNIDVKTLSDSQISDIAKKMEEKGLSLDEASKLAKMQGATDTQINDLKERMRGLKFSSEEGTGDLTKDDWAEEELEMKKKEVLSKKALILAKEKAKKIFGYQLFNSKNLTFEPSVNIPIPKDYVLGVSDELVVNVWGASQMNYDVKIDQNGNIQIPGVGGIQIHGMTFTEARTKIQNRLMNIYFGMRGPNPNTWADVTLNEMRSIKINVMGEALAPGTFTLPATASAFNALYLCGGPNENGSFRNIRVIRDNKIIKVIDVYDFLLNSDVKNNISLRDQDILYIPTYDIRVEVKNAFKRIGYYELKQNENLTDLLRYVGGFRDDALQSRLSVIRMTETQRKIHDVDEKHFKSFYPENGDIYSADSLLDRFENRIFITGAVNRPGVYALNKGLKLSELITKAEGLREDAYYARGLIIRRMKDLNRETVSFILSDVVEGKNDVELQREDSVVIQDIIGMREKRFVRIYGEVQRPGEFEFSENMNINDLVFLSGGLKEAASESYLEISRRHNYQESTQDRNEMVKLYRFDIDRNLQFKENTKQFQLEPFDYVYVRRAPSYFEQKTVTIGGEVLYPGKYSISSKEERISDLIQRAGGLKTYAYVQGATLFRQRPKAVQDTLILENIALNASYKSMKNKNVQDSNAVKTKLEKHLENARVELQLEKIFDKPGSVYDYHLCEGDSINIPEVSEEVHVAGAIYNPISMAYEPRKNAKYYIDRSGGFWDNANKKRVYVIYSDGTTKVTKGLLFGNKYPKVLPGSKIIVPEKPDKTQVDISRWLAIASTFASLAIAASAVLR